MPAITLEREGPLAWITIDNPPANAFTYTSYQELLDIVRDIDSDDRIRVALIRARGRFFSAGNDVHEFADPPVAPPGAIPAEEIIDVALGAIAQSRTPIIALVHGIAVGSGFCVAAYADIVVATPQAQFGIPEVKRGIIGGGPEAASVLPPKLVRYLALTGDFIDAEEAQRAGLVTKVVAAEELTSAGRRIAESILGNPPITVRLVKESLAEIYPPERIVRQIAADGPRNQVSAAAADYQEAVHAFLEKRTPNFRGH